MKKTMERTEWNNGNGWHGWAQPITRAFLSELVDATTGCGNDECYACDACYEAAEAGAAFDALYEFPAGVAVVRTGGGSPFGERFPSLTATRGGHEVATVSGFWTLDEGLWDLLAAVRDADGAE
jgi:hypothetical protein